MRWLNPLLTSIAIHLIGGFALLMAWPAAEVTTPRISTYLVLSSAETPKGTQASTKVSSSTQGSSRPKARPKQSEPSAAQGGKSTSRNGLLRQKETVNLMPRIEEESAKHLGLRPPAPDPREQKHDYSGWTSETKRDGKVAFTDKPLVEPPTIVVGKNGIMRLRFRIPDINEIVMRLRGDPMYDPEKRAYLSNTREAREAMAREFIRENLAQSLDDLGERLSTLWFDDTLSATTKRQRLFDMWEECAEEGSDAVLAISEIVRVSIMSFIKRNMANGTELAYTEDDLIRLNKNRKSKTAFNPYG